MFLALRLERVSNHGFKTIKLELVIELLSAIVTLRIPPAILLAWRPLFCWVPCQEFVLIIYDRIAHVMSILSVHITDVY